MQDFRGGVNMALGTTYSSDTNARADELKKRQAMQRAAVTEPQPPTNTPTQQKNEAIDQQYNLQRSQVMAQEGEKARAAQAAMQRMLNTRGFGAGSGFNEAQSRKTAVELARNAGERLGQLDVAQFGAQAQSAEAEKARQWQTGESMRGEKLQRDMQDANLTAAEIQQLNDIASREGLAAAENALQERMQGADIISRQQMQGADIVSKERMQGAELGSRKELQMQDIGFQQWAQKEKAKTEKELQAGGIQGQKELQAGEIASQERMTKAKNDLAILMQKGELDSAEKIQAARLSFDVWNEQAARDTAVSEAEKNRIADMTKLLNSQAFQSEFAILQNEIDIGTMDYQNLIARDNHAYKTRLDALQAAGMNNQPVDVSKLTQAEQDAYTMGKTGRSYSDYNKFVDDQTSLRNQLVLTLVEDPKLSDKIEDIWARFSNLTAPAYDAMGYKTTINPGTGRIIA